MSEKEPENKITNSANYKYGFIGLTLTIAIVASTALGFYLFENRGNNSEAGELELKNVKLETDYYVLVPLIEVSELHPNDRAWDRIDSSAPDLYVEIYWKRQKVHQSTTKRNTLIAKWSNAELNLLDLALEKGRASVDDVIRAARINARSNEEIELRVYDYDPLGSSDLVGSKVFKTSELIEGDKTYLFKGPGITRVTLRVLNMNDAPDLLK